MLRPPPPAEPGAAAGVLLPTPPEPSATENVSCGANVSPLIIFQSLSRWPGRFGNQPNPVQREKDCSSKFQNFP